VQAAPASPISVAAPSRTPTASAPLADVTRASERYAPSFGSLAPRDAARAQQLVARAMQGLQPRVLVNRGVEDAIAFLTRDAPMSTSFDLDKPGDAAWGAYMLERRTVEDRHGIHGEGEHAGRTVYGSLQLSDNVHPIGDTSHEHLNAGATRYGEVSLVVRPDVARDRATYIANDSFYADAKVGAAQQLPDIVLERVLRNFKVARERSGESSPWPDVPAPQLRARFDEILDLPDDQAVARLREHLTSDALTRTYVEAQIRTLRPDDIAEVRVDLDPAQRPGFDQTTSPSDRLADLRAAADALGIPLCTTASAAARALDA
jgi:hypothetical protein